MNKIILVFLIAFSFAGAAVAADKPLGVEEFTSVEELAFSLSSYFPKVHGEIKTVQGERLTLSLGKKDMIIPGMMLTIWRDGKEILHPVTNAVIGRVEEEVGTVEVVSVNDASSTAVVKKKLKEAVPGDKARITPKKINVAVVPVRTERSEVVRKVGQRLNEFGRVSVFDQGKVDAFIKGSKTKGTLLVKELGTAFGLDAVIAVSVYPTEGKLMVAARIFYTEDASQLDTIVALVDVKASKDALGEIKPFFAPQKEEKQASAELPFLSQLFVTGDFEGNGRQEYAFSDGTRIHIYRNEPSGWREVWTEVAVKDQPSSLEWQGQEAVLQTAAHQHINLDSADINGNGKPELFVTEMLNGKVLSYVLEFQEGSFRRVAEVSGFLRVTGFPGKGTILIGQSYDPVAFYAGQPKQMLWSQGKYVTAEEVRLPKGLSLYGWTFANFGENDPLLVALDDEDRLQVYSGGAPVWKSTDQYPVVATYVYKPASGVQAVLNKQVSPTDKSQRVRLPGRLFAIDINGDGKDEIIVPKNLTSGFLGGFSGAELDGLRWTGARLDPAWSIKDIPGPVFDVRFVQAPSGVRINALVRTQGGTFSKDRQQVMTYQLQ